MTDNLSLVEQVKAAMKAAMKAREKETLATIRLIQAEFKRVEVDERIDIDDARAFMAAFIAALTCSTSERLSVMV